MRRSLMTLALAALLGGGSGVTAWGSTNLVQNPGFEADTIGPPNYFVSPPMHWISSGDSGADNAFPHSGNNDGFIGTGGLSQTVATVSGMSYAVTFWVGINDANLASDSAASFDATLGGQDLLSGGISPSAVAYPGYTAFTDTVTPGANALLSFTGVINAPDGNWYLDDVSVVAVASSTIPEPPAILSLLAALGAIALVRRRTA